MNKPQLFIGIDPGAKGAICLLNAATQQMAFCSTGQSIKPLVEWCELAKKEGNIRFACIEDVHSLVGMSAKSNFNFGRNVQLLHDVLEMAELPKDMVQPKDWQKAVGIKSKKWPKGTPTSVRSKWLKEQVASLCTNLYPSSSKFIYGPQGGLRDGNSDALMIAHYCYLTHKLAE